MIKQNTKYGLIQLDSRWVINNRGELVPEYPSIILGESIKWDRDQYNFEKEELKYGGTELISYLRTVDSNFDIEIKNLYNYVKDNGGESSKYIFEFKGYAELDTDPDSINFGELLYPENDVGVMVVEMWFRKFSNDDIHFYSDINFYVEKNYDYVNKLPKVPLLSHFNIILQNSSIADLFNGRIRLYLTISPYSREQCEEMYNVITYNRKILTDMYIYIRYGQNITIPELLSYFLNTTTDDIDLDVGTQDLTGVLGNDDIGIPPLPSDSILDGLHSMYSLNRYELNNLNKSLFTTDFAINVLKLLSNPLDYIISLSISPLTPPKTPNKFPIVVGNLNMVYQTENDVIEQVTANKLTEQFVTYEFGSIQIFENSYNEYNSKIEIYIPFIGTQSLDVNDVVGSNIELVWNVDFFTGNFVAFLLCYKPKLKLNSVLYNWKGNFLTNIPLTGSNYSQTLLSGVSSIISLSTGNVQNAFTNILGNIQPQISKGDNISGGTGVLGIFDAYITISTPIEDKPNNYNKLIGTPLNTSNSLLRGMGYIICESVHITDIECTEDEKEQLEKLLKSGVIL